MTSSETIGAIAPALIKAQSQMQGITKEGKNPAFRSKYVTLDSILDTLRPILTSNGLMLTQGSQQPETMQAVTVESRIIHTSGEWIATTVTIPVTKPDAHGLGSALTYGRRYSPFMWRSLHLGFVFSHARIFNSQSGAINSRPSSPKAR